jgi:hypothetical protein
MLRIKITVEETKDGNITTRIQAYDVGTDKEATFGTLLMDLISEGVKTITEAGGGKHEVVHSIRKIMPVKES